MKRSLPAITLLVVASEGGYLFLARFAAVNGVAPVASFVTVMAILFALSFAAWAVLAKSSGRAPFLVAFAGAILFRLTLVPAGLPADLPGSDVVRALRADLRGEGAYERFLLYDHDLWRYLWDGHVFALKGDPYRWAPDDSRLDGIATGEWERIRSYVNHPSHRTVYPPGAQFFFRLSHALAPASVAMLKLLWIAVDVLAIAFLALALRAAGRPLSWAVLYAWNPLVIKVFAGSGHADVVVVCALAGCTWLLLVRGRGAAGAAFAVAVAAKLTPVVLLPLVLRRLGKRGVVFAVLTAACLFVPFAGAAPEMIAALRSFGGQWEFNGGPYELIRAVTGDGSSARVACALIAIAVITTVALRDDGRPLSFARAGSLTLGISLVLSPVVMPWYATWVLPLAVVAGDLVWVVFTMLVCAAFVVMARGDLPPLVLAVEYTLLAALFCWKWIPGIRRESIERRSDNDQTFPGGIPDVVLREHRARAGQRLDGRREERLEF